MYERLHGALLVKVGHDPEEFVLLSVDPDRPAHHSYPYGTTRLMSEEATRGTLLEEGVDAARIEPILEAARAHYLAVSVG
jgi:hypothetical protein